MYCICQINLKYFVYTQDIQHYWEYFTLVLAANNLYIFY